MKKSPGGLGEPRMAQRMRFVDNHYNSFMCTFFEYESANDLLTSCKNHVYEKNLVLELWT